MKTFQKGKKAVKAGPAEEVQSSDESDEVLGNEEEDDSNEEEDSDLGDLKEETDSVDEEVKEEPQELDLEEDSGEDESDDDKEEPDELGLEEGSGEEESGSENEGEDEEKIPFDTPRVTLRHNLTNKYTALKGKQLFVRFPHKLPESADELERLLKGFCKRITKVVKPRQNYARFCTVEFANEKDRDLGLIELQKAVLENERKLHVELPRHEDTNYVENLIKMKEMQKEKKKTKLKLNKMARKKAKRLTSAIFVTNIPPTATVADIKELFPNSVDINFKHVKGGQEPSKATIVLQTPEDASAARKRAFKIDETELRIKFAGNLSKKREKKESKAVAKGKSPEANKSNLKRKPQDGSIKPSQPPKKAKLVGRGKKAANGNNKFTKKDSIKSE